MTGSELFYFTGKLMTLHNHPERRDALSDVISGKDFNPGGFIKLCSDHLIIPLIYRNLNSAGITSLFPGEVTEHFEAIYKMNLDRNRQILAEAGMITESLNSEGIFPVFLKGTANLADGLYDDPAIRMIGDIDLLVREDEYLKSAAIIRNLGFRNDEKISEKRIITSKHYPRLWNDDAVADIEIHRRVVDRYSKYLSPEMIFSDMHESSTIKGCFVPSEEHRIIHNFIHTHINDRGYLLGTASFRQVFDLYLLRKKNPGAEVNIEPPLSERASSYFAIAGKIFDLKISGEIPSVTAERYCQRFDLFMKYPLIYRANRFQCKIRNALFNKLWYLRQLNRIKSFFLQKPG